MTTFTGACEDGVKLARMYPPPVTSPDLGPQPFFPSVMSHASDILIGKPAQFFDELAQGRAFAPGTYSRYAVTQMPPKNPSAGTAENLSRYLAPAFMYAPAIFSAYGALSAPEGEKGPAFGEAVGSALGTAAGAPFGYLGNMIGGMIGGNIGRSVGATFGG